MKPTVSCKGIARIVLPKKAKPDSTDATDNPVIVVYQMK